ncbi:MAG: hypothetical protein ACREQJ_07390, partial [Candidatus Binatia bacterium]
MRSRIWSIGALVLAAAVGVGAAEKRPTAETGGLFSLFTRGGEEQPAEPEAAGAEAPASEGEPGEGVAAPAEPAPAAPSEPETAESAPPS